MAEILHVVDIHATPEVVYDTLATAEGIRRWWSTQVEGNSVEGSGDDSEITVRFGEEWKVVMTKIDAVPNERIAYRITQHDSDEWPGTELHFELSPVEEWTLLRFDHRGWAESSDFFRFCSAKWVVFLLSIKQAAETGMGTPWPDEKKIGRMD